MPAPVVWSEPSYMLPSWEGKFAALPDGSVMAIWDSIHGVYRQIMNADGTPKGTALRIDGTDDPNQRNAKIVALEDGRFVVTWVETLFVNQVAFTDVKARILNADGSVAGNAFYVNSVNPDNDQHSPMVSAMKGGGFVIGYQSDSGAESDAFVQVFDRNGGRVGPEFAASNGTAGVERAPHVVGLQDGNYAFLYIDWSSTSTVVRGVIRTPEGQLAPGTSPFTVPNDGKGNEQNALSAALLSDGRFVVAWESRDIPESDTSGWGIYAQVFNPDGSRSGHQISVNSTVAGNQRRPFVTALQDGGFAVAFEDGVTNARLRTFNSKGAPESDDVLIHSQGRVGLGLSGLSCTKDGRIIATWSVGDAFPQT